MNKIIAKSVTFLFAVLFIFSAAPFTAVAGIVTSGIFTYTIANGKATITGCSSSASGDITIPAAVGDYRVAKIGESAFRWCDRLTSVIIPDSVKNIGNEAFSECPGLTSITVSEANKVYTSENGVLFNKTKTELIQYPAHKMDSLYTIPNGLKSIGNWAFNGCILLNRIIIPDSILTIGDVAFSGCINLKSITIPDSVASIGEAAFSDTAWYNNQQDGLIYAGKLAYGYKGNMPENTTVVLKSGTKGIADGAFQYCDRLKNIIIPDSVTSIGHSAFAGCKGLKIVEIPKSVKSIGYTAFSGCTGLTSITVSTANAVYASEHGVLFNKSKSELFQYPGGKTGFYTIPESVKIIGGWAFSYCSGLTGVTFGNSVSSIEGAAFYGCSGLTYISIPNNVTSIGNSTFYECTGLKKVVIPNSVTRIEEETFRGCAILKSITIPSSVTKIGEWAFEGCTVLKSITIPSSVISVGNSAFSGTRWYADQSNGLVYIGKVAYKYKGMMPDNTAISVKSGTKEITDGAFADCSGLTSIIIPDGLTGIGKNAFSGCTELRNIIISNSVTSIGDAAFKECTKLKSVTIPRSVTDIDDFAFGFYGYLPGEEYSGYALKIPGFTINCYADSAGLKYAKENGFAYNILPASTIITDPDTTTSTAGSGGISNRMTIIVVIMASVVFWAAAVTAVIVVVKKRRKISES